MKISEGRVRDQGVTWFHELADKREDCFTLNISTCIGWYVWCAFICQDSLVLGHEELRYFT